MMEGWGESDGDDIALSKYSKLVCQAHSAFRAVHGPMLRNFGCSMHGNEVGPG